MFSEKVNAATTLEDDNISTFSKSYTFADEKLNLIQQI